MWRDVSCIRVRPVHSLGKPDGSMRDILSIFRMIRVVRAVS